MFKIMNDNFIQRVSDGAIIPIDEGNRDYRAYLAWVAEGNAPQEPDPIPITSADVNRERDRRTAAGIPFMGHVFDFDQMGKDNITGAATLAKFAILKGAQPGDYRWANPNVDFSWIVQSNEKVLMDAHQVSALGDVAANWATLHIFAARAIKDMVPIPADFADDKYWPEGK